MNPEVWEFQTTLHPSGGGGATREPAYPMSTTWASHKVNMMHMGGYILPKQ